ncbi:MAG: hypothetical protein WD027_01200 [Gaiellales bacterium]
MVTDCDSASPAARDAESLAWHDKDGKPIGRAYVDQGVHAVELDGVARFSFAPDTNEVVAVPAPGVDREVLDDYFRRWILPLAVQVRGLEVLHASAVSGRNGVAAFCAASEAGKSTLAYGLGVRGYRIWTDDALAFDVVERRPEALPLPFRVRLRPRSAAHFGVSARGPAGALVETPPAEADGSVPITVVFLLDRSAGVDPVELSPVAPLEAFPALLEQSYHFGAEDVARKRTMLSRYLDLASRVPVYRLRMATGLEHLDLVLDAVEERL